MKQVLLLNASEEALAIISWQRAVTMLCSGKAYEPYNFEESYDIPTPSGVFQLPTAIILHAYVTVPFKRVQPTRKNVLQRDRYICQYCGKLLTLGTCTLDHVVPQCKNGPSDWRNLVASCKKCNSKKGDMTPEKANMKLMVRPFIPTRNFLMMNAIDKSMNGSWKRWMPRK